MADSREKAIFLSAIDLSSPAERDALLERECGGDAALRRAVDELLQRHDRSVNVLDKVPTPCAQLGRRLDELALRWSDDPTPPLEPASTADRAGEWVGAYRLMEKIGEGGFGQVYVAEQLRPVRRRVALKLLKPWMDSREIIARFEAERQALALMEHPNIARVLDAGTTAAGQPYFVMELVRGVPITTFCEQRRLNIRERMRLFVDVCLAVQHAHQKGVIHRDLKPTNVLVALYEARPTVKVIDFGVSKALGEPLTDKTIYTRFAQMIGTPMYMSPEQAEMNSMDIDTRSDVYSLGVLMYELLTMSTPFDPHRMQTVTFDEMRRIIREEEPPRPSVRVSTLREAASKTAPGRPAEGRSLAGVLRGDLDWIALKAMEKDRRRRYDTAADLARDVQRFLEHQPVVARPPSAWYRLQRLAERNKVLVTATLLVLLSLVAGVAVSTWHAIRATRAFAEADQLRQQAVDFSDRLKQANVLIDNARANAGQQRWSLAWSQCTRATELQPEHYLTWSERGSLAARLGAWRSACDDFARALELGAPANNPGWWGVPQLCIYTGNRPAYERISHALRTHLDTSDDPWLFAFSCRSLLLEAVPAEEALQLAQRMDDIVATLPTPNRQPSRGPDRPFRDSGPGRSERNFSPPFRGNPNAAEAASRPRSEPGYRGMPVELQWYAAALAHYRADQMPRALEYLDRLTQIRDRFPPSQMALPLLALVQFNLGESDAAAESLRGSDEAIQRWLTTVEEEGLDQLPVPWSDFLESWILYCEAHTLIRGEPPLLDPRFELLEERALATLHGS